jgi:hypothetical protein
MAFAPNALKEAKAHLGAAIMQTVPTDDQIIMDHVRAAYTILCIISDVGLAIAPHMHVAGTTVGKHIDECALCGQDLRCEVHRSSSSLSSAQSNSEAGK